MPPPASILCPVDFSAHAERALRHAVALAGAFQARLTVLTVNDPLLVSATSAAGYGHTLRDQVEAELSAVLSRAPAHAPRLVPAVDIATGPAPDEILRSADRSGADLIVMGTQGLGGASKMMFGSTTERVVRQAAVPVLAVPEYSPERMRVDGGRSHLTLGAVVAAIGLDQHDDAVAGAAATWAVASGATLTLTHICHEAAAPSWWPFTGSPLPSEPVDTARARVETLAASVDPRARPAVDVRRGGVTSGVAEVARERDAGLLVVSRGAGEHRLGAVAYRIMCAADIPTLVVARLS